MFDRNYELTADLILVRTEYDNNNNDYEIQETAWYVIQDYLYHLQKYIERRRHLEQRM